MKIKGWNVINHNYHKYISRSELVLWSGHLRESQDLIFPTILCLISADTKLHELALRRAQLGRLWCVMYGAEF